MSRKIAKGKSLRRILSAILTLAMVFSLVPMAGMPVYATAPTCKIGTAPYLSISEALDAAGSEQTTITLLRDAAEAVTVNAGKNIILDLNGNTIDAKENGRVIINAGTLTVKNGTLKNGKLTASGYVGAGVLNINGELTVENLTITNCCSAAGGAAIANLDGHSLIVNSLTISNCKSTAGTHDSLFYVQNKGVTIKKITVDDTNKSNYVFYNLGSVDGIKIADADITLASEQLLYGRDNANRKLVITGGQYSCDVRAYIANGYKCVEDGGKYKVVPALKFDLRNGAGAADVGVSFEYNNPTAPSDGFTFAGWSTAVDDLSAKVNTGENGSYGVEDFTPGATYYAIWEKGGSLVYTQPVVLINSNNSSGNGYTWDATDKKLTLSGITMYVVSAANSGAIVLPEDDVKVIVADSSENSITVASSLAAKKLPAIKAQKNINISGGGKLTVSGYNGIVAGSNIVIADATITIQNTDDSPIVSTGGDITIKSGSIESNVTQGIRADTGSISIVDGTVNITATHETQSRALHAGSKINIAGGTVTLNAKKYGMVANAKDTSVEMTGGTVSVSSPGTAIWAEGNVIIGGDNLVLKAESTGKIGIESNNGNVSVTAGDVLISSESQSDEHPAILAEKGTIFFAPDLSLTVSGNTPAATYDGEKFISTSSHKWIYSVNEAGDTLTAACNGKHNADCLFKANGVSLTLITASKTYTGGEVTSAASFTEESAAAWTEAELTVPTTIAYSYKAAKTDEYAPVEKVEKAGWYKATATVTDAVNASNTATAEKEFTVSYVVEFNANTGTGSMEAVETPASTYTLPANAFTAPENKTFKGWATSAEGEILTETELALTENTTLYAVWGVKKIVFGEETTTTPVEKADKDTIETVSFVTNNTITTIGENTFKDCENLETVILPVQVNEIQSGAFALTEEQTGETDLTISAAVEKENGLTIAESAFANRTSVTLILYSEAKLWTKDGDKLSSDSFMIGTEKAVLTENAPTPTALSDKIFEYDGSNYEPYGNYQLRMDDKDYSVRLLFKKDSGEVQVISGDSGSGALLLIGTAAATGAAIYYAPAIQAKAEQYGIGKALAAKLVKAHDFFFLVPVDRDEEDTADKAE